MFKKFKFDSDKIYTIQPYRISSDFIHLLNLLTNEEIKLTFNEREELYDHIEYIIKFLEEKKRNGSNN